MGHPANTPTCLLNAPALSQRRSRNPRRLAHHASLAFRPLLDMAWVEPAAGRVGTSSPVEGHFQRCFSGSEVLEHGQTPRIHRHFQNLRHRSQARRMF